MVSKSKSQGSGVQSAAIEQIATADLVPYARNATESVGCSERRAATANSGSQHWNIVEKREWFGEWQEFCGCEQSSMEHVVMIRAQRHKVRQITGPAVFQADDVMNRSCVFESTQNAFTAVSDSGGVLARAVAGFRDSSECAAMRFLSAFIGTKRTLITPPKARRSDGNRIAADFAWDSMSIVKRVFFASPCTPKCITTIARTIDAIRQIRPDVEHVTAMLTDYFSRSLSSPTTIVA